MEAFKPLHAALEGLQDALRRAGLQHLAAQVPVATVRTEDEFLQVQRQLQVLRKLLLLRPPKSRAFGQILPALDRITALVAAVEKGGRERYKLALEVISEDVQ
jgi:hypothetical protein